MFLPTHVGHFLFILKISIRMYGHPQNKQNLSSFFALVIMFTIKLTILSIASKCAIFIKIVQKIVKGIRSY